jgi:hypothetical protein
VTKAGNIPAKPAAQPRGARKGAGGTTTTPRETSRHNALSTATQAVSILDAIDDPAIWAGWFKRRATWAPWRTFLAVLFGLPLDPAGLELYRQCTGRDQPPAIGFLEAWLICGRRAGKSFTLALIACFLAVFRDWRPYLSPGEVGTIKIIATDRRQARVIHRYCRALLTKVPAFASLVTTDTDDAIELTNGVTIEIQTASFRSVRGFTVVAVLADEIAFWSSDEASANPDAEIIAAIRPAMATIPNAMFLAASSPYARRGELWNAYDRRYGRDDAPELVWHAPTRTMNPTVPQSLLDREIERDPAKGRAEYLAEFRSDIETFIDIELVRAATDFGVTRRNRCDGVTYVGFVDPSGGRGDSFTCAIGHRDGNDAVIDVLYEKRAPFNDTDEVIEEIARLLRYYRVASVRGDSYGAELVVSAFRRYGISYKPLRLNDGEGTQGRLSRSEIYLNVITLFTSGRARLLDSERLTHQLVSLQRRVSRTSGRDLVDHPPGGSDDVANAACGCLVALAGKHSPMTFSKSTLQKIAALPQRDRFYDPAIAQEHPGHGMRAMMIGRNRFARAR